MKQDTIDVKAMRDRLWAVQDRKAEAQGWRGFHRIHGDDLRVYPEGAEWRWESGRLTFGWPPARRSEKGFPTAKEAYADGAGLLREFEAMRVQASQEAWDRWEAERAARI